VLYATLLAPLPYPKPDQLVVVWSKVGGDRNVVSAGDFVEWRRRSTAFQELNASDGNSFNLSTAEHPEQVAGEDPRHEGLQRLLYASPCLMIARIMK